MHQVFSLESYLSLIEDMNLLKYKFLECENDLEGFKWFNILKSTFENRNVSEDKHFIKALKLI